MTFAGISVVNPRWLQDLSRSGAGVEARTAKEFGDNLLLGGNVRHAISQYHLALQFQPDYTEAMCNLGIAYARLQDPARAETWLMKALTFPEANRGVAHFYLAELDLQRGRFDEAAGHLQSAQEFGYNLASVWRLRAEVHSARKQWVNARSAYESAIVADRDMATAYRNMLYRDLPFAKADSLADFVTADMMMPFDSSIYHFQQQRDPEISKTCNDLGIMCLRTGDTLRAMEYWKEAVAIWPETTRHRAI